MFIGPLLCLAVPPETNAKGLIVASVIFQLINTVMVVVSMFSIFPMMQGIGQLFGFISAVLFVLFMRRLALFVGRQDLADRARNILILGAITVVVSMLGLFSLIVPAMGMLFLGVGILGIIMFVMYANLVNYLRLALKPSSVDGKSERLESRPENASYLVAVN